MKGRVAGIVNMPFQGSTGAGPTALQVTYEGTKTSITATGLIPIAAPPLITLNGGLDGWNFVYPTANWVRLTNVSDATVHAVIKLNGLAVTPGREAELPVLVANVHYRIACTRQSSPFSGAGVYNDGTTYRLEGTLTDLSTTGVTIAGNLAPATFGDMKIVFWLDDAAPISLQNLTFTGTLAVSSVL